MLGVCLSSFLSLTAPSSYGNPYPVKINPCAITYLMPRTNATGCIVHLTSKFVEVTETCDALNQRLSQIVRP